MGGLSGTCLCGDIQVRVQPRTSEVGACHCASCRKWSGGPFMALDCGEDVEIRGGDSLGVYKSSQWAERVFCKTCGTVVAWRLQEGGEYHVAAHLFGETDDYPLGLQVFIDEKPDNYSFAETTKTMTGAQLFAMFAPPNGSQNDA